MWHDAYSDLWSEIANCSLHDKIVSDSLEISHKPTLLAPSVWGILRGLLLFPNVLYIFAI